MNSGPEDDKVVTFFFCLILPESGPRSIGEAGLELTVFLIF